MLRSQVPKNTWLYRLPMLVSRLLPIAIAPYTSNILHKDMGSDLGLV